MYYWSRTGSIVDILLFAALSALWALGGLLVTEHAFHLKQREKLVVGLAVGFLLFIVLSNLLAQLLPLTAAYWTGAAIIFLFGLGSMLWSRTGLRDSLRLFNAWPQLVALLAMILLFTLILRGLAIFDDYYHLPMISVMATGDIPPHFYLDPTLHLPYHYGLQVFAASMVRLAGFFPWSAWDISRAIVYGFTIILAWLWIRRMTGSRLPAYLGSGLLAFGGGARWLLLFFPMPMLESMGANLHMDLSGLSAGGNLVTALANRWPIEGGGPFPFPYAYASGIFEPLNMQLGATGAMWQMTILVLLLVWRPRLTSLAGLITTGLILASLALSAEHVFALTVAGMVLILVASLIRNRHNHHPNRKEVVKTWGIPAAIAVILALFQGGYITGGFMRLLSTITGGSYPMVTTDFQGFSLRWPPAVPSGHFGPLVITDPGQLVILLAEAGPALILLPFMAAYWVKKLRKDTRLPQALAAGSILSLLFPVFFRYGLDFDITRLVGASLWISLALGFPFLWLWLVKDRQGFHLLAAAGYGMAVFSGLVMLAVEFIAIPVVQTTYYLKYQESDFSKPYWNRLEKDAQILDSVPERAVLLFGRASFAAEDVYQRSPKWQALIANPDPASVAAAGYTYVYMDVQWWNNLSIQSQSAYSQPCVQLVAEMKLAGSQDRRLYYVGACHP